MIINLELYRSFITVAEQGSFTRAANELGLTQSAVSQAVKNLEELLETQLFVRSARGAALTSDGAVLMGHVGGLLRGVDTAQRYFTQLKSLKSGSLKIGASDTLCRHVLLDRLKVFHENYPGVSVQVTNRTSGETVALMLKGAVDIGLVNLPLDGLDAFDVHEVMIVHDCFVCGDRYAPMFIAPAPLSALEDMPVIMLERQSSSRRWLDRYLQSAGSPIKPQIELGSLDLLSDFAERNLGIAAVVREFVADRIDSGRLKAIQLTREIPSRSVGVITRKGVPPSAAALELMGMLL